MHHPRGAAAGPAKEQSDENWPILDSISRSNHRRCDDSLPRYSAFQATRHLRALRKSASENTRFRSAWSDHNPSLLLAGSVLVRDASAGLQCTSWSRNSILSRLNFIFASAVFSAVYLVRFNELEISLWRFVLLSTVLFSIFCYTLELERLGRALLERKDRS